MSPRSGDGTLVRWARRDRVTVVTLDRPAKLNAITDDLMTELVSVLQAVAEDDATELVVLEGAGRAFCAGFDISTGPPSPATDGVRDGKDDPDAKRAYWQSHFELARQMLVAIWDLPQPVLAKIRGACLGGGMHLMLACDLAIASDDAYFGEPEVRFGGVPSFPLLPAVTGLRRANEIWMGGGTVSAPRALEMGLVNRVVAAAELDEVVEGTARHLTLVPQGTLRRVKAVSHQMGEVLGAREALRIGRDAAIEALTERGPEATAFDELVSRDGLKAGLAWLQERFVTGHAAGERAEDDI
jgi:enoyl-CoA hydratase